MIAKLFSLWLISSCVTTFMISSVNSFSFQNFISRYYSTIKTISVNDHHKLFYARNSNNPQVVVESIQSNMNIDSFSSSTFYPSKSTVHPLKFDEIHLRVEGQKDDDNDVSNEPYDYKILLQSRLAVLDRVLNTLLSVKKMEIDSSSSSSSSSVITAPTTTTTATALGRRTNPVHGDDDHDEGTRNEAIRDEQKIQLLMRQAQTLRHLVGLYTQTASSSSSSQYQQHQQQNVLPLSSSPSEPITILAAVPVRPSSLPLLSSSLISLPNDDDDDDTLLKFAQQQHHEQQEYDRNRYKQRAIVLEAAIRLLQRANNSKNHINTNSNSNNGSDDNSNAESTSNSLYNLLTKEMKNDDDDDDGHSVIASPQCSNISDKDSSNDSRSISGGNSTSSSSGNRNNHGSNINSNRISRSVSFTTTTTTNNNENNNNENTNNNNNNSNNNNNNNSENSNGNFNDTDVAIRIINNNKREKVISSLSLLLSTTVRSVQQCVFATMIMHHCNKVYNSLSSVSSYLHKQLNDVTRHHYHWQKQQQYCIHDIHE